MCSVMSNSETLWTIACQAPLSMGFFSQEYWSGLPFPPPRDLPIPGIEPMSPVAAALQAVSLPTEPLGKPKRMHSTWSLNPVTPRFRVSCTQIPRIGA